MLVQWKDRVIWKEQFAVQDTFELELPKNCKVLSVGHQYNEPCIWFMFHPRASTPTAARRFYVLGTGHERLIPETARFIGTFLLYGGDFVGHLFEDMNHD